MLHPAWHFSSCILHIPQSLRGCVPSLKGAEQLNPPQTKTEGRGTKPTSWPALVEDAQVPKDPAKTNMWAFKAVSESLGHPALCSQAHLKLFNLSPPSAWMPLTPHPPVPCSQRWPSSGRTVVRNTSVPVSMDSVFFLFPHRQLQALMTG